MNHTEERAVWDAIWTRSQGLPARDLLSELLFEALVAILDDPPRGPILEAGSGSGRISARLASRGYNVLLMDRSLAALRLSRRFFDRHQARLVLGEIRAFPFRNGAFDVVWNSGVLEHWSDREQRDVLHAAARITRSGGLFVTFNPYQSSVVYRLGKVVLEIVHLWPYGEETPVRTLAHGQGSEWQLESERSLAFLAIPANVFRLLPRCSAVDRMIQRWAVAALDRPRIGRLIRRLDRLLSNHLGGYLLVSTFRRAAR